MKCENCGCDDATRFMVLPIHRETGELDSIFCEKCAQESRAYCLKHEMIHLGFCDGTTACPTCIDKEAESLRNRVHAIFDEIYSVCYRELRDSDLLKGVSRGTFLRLIIIRAKRDGVPVDFVIKRIKTEKKIDFIFN